ncbi:hypothetical protein GW17_00010217 [Ensete ventricosum]|nr:hypothetical protein GW17_00010217 [Ensete ventricosum]
MGSRTFPLLPHLLPLSLGRLTRRPSLPSSAFLLPPLLHPRTFPTQAAATSAVGQRRLCCRTFLPCSCRRPAPPQP